MYSSRLGLHSRTLSPSWQAVALAAAITASSCRATPNTDSNEKPANEVTTSTQTDSAANVRQVVVNLASKLEAEYVIADVGSRMAVKLRADLSNGRYDGLLLDSKLANLLTENLRAIAHDKHLQIAEPGWSPQSLNDNSARPMDTFYGGGIKKLDVLEGNIGYIEIYGMEPVNTARNPIANAFYQLRDTDALILDARRNGGGDPRTVALYISYLREGPPFINNRFRWREDNQVQEFWTTQLGALGYGESRPLYILTSKHTFSAGEELAYCLQAQGRGTVVGAVTGGGANPMRGYGLPHNFLAMIPYAQGENPITGTNWEGTGVTPDVKVPQQHALAKALQLISLKRLKPQPPAQ